jgi:hypothetical protein
MTKKICKTTAIWCQEAMEAEKRLEWGRAIDLWQAAMDNYPTRPLTAIGRKDVDSMERRQQACLAMYFPS